MISNPILRLVIGVPAAAFIVYALFALMNALITVDEVELKEESQRALEAITPQEEQQEARLRSRNSAKKLNSANKPPPPPKLSTNKSQIDLPTPNIQGQAPTELNFDRVQTLSIDPVAISDRDAQPIRPPIVTYPSGALSRGLEGTCDVRFDVNVQGRPYNVEADCTNSAFRREAVRAVSRVEFAPKIVRGKPAERRNVVYPLSFTLDN